MVRVGDVKFIKTGLKLFEYYGLSTDDKPTEMVATGSVFFEIDTSKAYMFDEESETWVEV